MSRGRQPIRDPRRIGAHVCALIDEMHDLGITGIECRKTKHIVIDFTFGGRRLRMHVPGTPDDVDVSARAMVRDLHHAIRGLA